MIGFVDDFEYEGWRNIRGNSGIRWEIYKTQADSLVSTHLAEELPIQQPSQTVLESLLLWSEGKLEQCEAYIVLDDQVSVLLHQI